MHEHNRPDRSDFLVVDLDNLEESYAHNYNRRNYSETENFDDDYPNEVDTGLTPFDFSSGKPSKLIHGKLGGGSPRYTTFS